MDLDHASFGSIFHRLLAHAMSLFNVCAKFEVRSRDRIGDQNKEDHAILVTPFAGSLSPTGESRPLVSTCHGILSNLKSLASSASKMHVGKASQN